MKWTEQSNAAFSWDFPLKTSQSNLDKYSNISPSFSGYNETGSKGNIPIFKPKTERRKTINIPKQDLLNVIKGLDELEREM